MRLGSFVGRGVGAALFALLASGAWAVLTDRFVVLDSVGWRIGFPLSGAGAGAVAGPYLLSWPVKRLARGLAAIPVTTLVLAAVGLVLGLAMGALLSAPFSQLPGWGGTLGPAALTVLLAILGVGVAVQREKDLLQFAFDPRRPVPPRTSHGQETRILLDTSAIIDGRIADVEQAGFIQGAFVVPRFVLDELRHIADSSDPLRRNRGRRGLEMLNKLSKESAVPFQVLDVGLNNGADVDSQLVQLAKNLHAAIVTTDYNLNRVAGVEGVRVLNVNELANALRPVALPGEEMRVYVVQEGKEVGQGVGFLDDGTMVVVEGGKRHINTHLSVAVTRVLQTPAGRIIFAQPKL